MMNADDPKFTAYALDELEPAERAAVEAELRAHPDLAAELEEFRSFTAQLRGELQAEEGAPLSPEQRAVVLGQAPRVVAGPGGWWRRPWLQSAAAACVIVGLIAAHFARQEVKMPRVAMGQPAEPVVKLTLDREADLPQLATVMPDLNEVAAGAKPSTAPMTNEHLNLSAVQLTPPGKTDDVKRSIAGLADPSLAANGASTEKALGAQIESLDASQATAGTRFTVAEAKIPHPQSITARAVPVAVIDETRANDRYSKVYGVQMGREVQPSIAGVSGGTSGTVVLSAESKNGGTGGLGAESSRPSLATSSLEQNQFKGLAGQARGGGNLGLTAPRATPVVPGKPVDLYAKANNIDSLQRSADRSWNYRNRGANAEDYARAPQESFGEGLQLADNMEVAPEAEVQGHNTEAYDTITDNVFCATKEQPLSTFSVDVDTASYANVRRMLNANERPPKGAVRIEELVNYFRYDYPQPDGADAFTCKTEVATCPWQTGHRLACVGIKGRELKRESRPVANLVFLIDVSGSMQPENKLPLVKQSLGLLIDQLGAEDTVAMAVYAGASGCVLEPTHDRDKMRGALDRLQAGGSTNGAAGIQLAYDLAQRSFKKGGTNRVILCTDGDFNVGITSQSDLVSMIQGKAKTGIFLSVFGFGMGNLKDSTLEKLADKGNGNYGYIDTLAEGRKVFVEQMTGTLFTIAKDVKIQVEFNPTQVAAYRLIGYENRLLAKEDFNDDKKDAGEIGAGHTVTALYEVVPAGQEVPDAPVVDDLKYQKPAKREVTLGEAVAASKEMLTVKVRYKQPDADVSKKLEFPLTDGGATWEKSSKDFRWAASVASFGLLLRDSPHKGTANWNMTLELATEGKGDDRDGYRSEFVGLVEKAKALSR